MNTEFSPRWKHHPNGEERLIRTQREEDSLEPEWADKPYGEVPEAEKPVVVDAAELAIENERLREELGLLTLEHATLGAAHEKLQADVKKAQADAKKAAKAKKAEAEPQQ